MFCVECFIKFIMKRQKVIDPLASAYVDASAGSGKTKLLIDRIVRLLLSGVSPSKILCITFTNAAADEMSGRLRSKLLSFLTMTNQELYNALDELHDTEWNQDIIEVARGLFIEFIADSPKIDTLHGFSAKILNKMQVINLNDNLIRESSYLLDENKKFDLLYESFNEIMLEYENIEIRNALNITLKRYNAQYIFDIIDEFWMESSNTNNIQYIGEDLNANQVIRGIREKLYQLHDVNNSISKQDIINSYIYSCDYNVLIEIVNVLSTGNNITSKSGANAIQQFISQRNEDTFFIYANILLTADFKPRARLPLDATMCKKYDHLRQFLLIQQEILSNIMEKIQNLISAELNSALNIITWYVLKKFNQKKKELGLFEYSDLIKNTISIINDSNNKMALLYSIDMGLEHILIDEAQDLSEMQWSLIKTITDEFFVGIGTTTNIRTIFIVGDFKQAIFSFQGAAPYIFQQVKQYFRTRVISVGQIWYEMQLDTCYRCAPEILKVVDKVCNSMKQSFDMSSQESIEHHSTQSYGYGLVQCHEVISTPLLQAKAETTWHLPRNIQPEIIEDESWYIAQEISNTIYNWLSEDKRIGKLQHSVKPQDIMILLKKRSTLQDHLVTALKMKDIPISNLAAKTFGNSIYIYDLFSVLRFILQPFDQMNLVALLKSHPFNYNDHQIFDLCQDHHYSIYLKIKNTDLIKEIIYHAQTLDLKDFFHWYLNKVYKLENQDTLRFLTYILTYYQTTNPFKISAQNFMLWLDDVMGNKEQKLYDNKSVRITTIHSAKGLEAPIVILADVYTPYKISHTKFACKDDIFILNSKYSNQKVKSIINHSEIALKMENIRLLYVAMTRPKSELHLFGTYDSKDSWYSLIKSAI